MLSFIARAPYAFSRLAIALLAAFALASTGTIASAQGVETFDPDEIFAAPETASPTAAQPARTAASRSIDADLADPNARQAPPLPTYETPTYTVPQRVPESAQQTGQQIGGQASQAASEPGFDGVFDPYSDYGAASSADPAAAGPNIAAAGNPPAVPAPNPQDASTYGEDDLIGAAEGVFGKGAEGLARMIQGLLKDQGQPNGYIVGREAGGAFIFGARYGSGTLHHKVEGNRKVYWTGPSVGFDVGANAANTFVLVYNLYDTQDLFKRYAAGEGQAYLIGGLNASYVRRGDVVLIPIRLGVGARLGINAGYMKFSEKQRWLPF